LFLNTNDIVRKRLLFVYVGIVVSMLLWSLSFIWYKQAYEVGFKPIGLIFARLFFSAALLWFFLIIVRQNKLPNRKIIGQIAIAAFFEPFLYFVGECYGLTMVTSTTAAVIVATVPLFAPLAALFLLRERISFFNWLGIFLSVFGIVMVMMGNGLHFSASTVGILLMFLAVLSAVGYSVAIKKVAGSCPPVMIVALQNTFGTLYFLPLFFFIDGGSLSLSDFSFSTMLPLINLAVFASSLAFILYVKGLDKIGVAKANVLVNLIPAFTAIFSFFILGEKLGLAKIIGVMVVIAGVFVSQLKTKAEGQQPEEIQGLY
jgi:drug/metabolite transporter (DMT)-like permease